MKKNDKLRQILVDRYAAKMHINPFLFKYYWRVVAESELGKDCPTLISISSDGSLSSEWIEKHQFRTRLTRQREIDEFSWAMDDRRPD